MALQWWDSSILTLWRIYISAEGEIPVDLWIMQVIVYCCSCCCLSTGVWRTGYHKVLCKFNFSFKVFQFGGRFKWVSIEILNMYIDTMQYSHKVSKVKINDHGITVEVPMNVTKTPFQWKYHFTKYQCKKTDIVNFISVTRCMKHWPASKSILTSVNRLWFDIVLSKLFMLLLK